ncbi:MAG: methylated-DNA--[protein]-cysteine S-methyltransferase [Parasporobacterium sp.]|nr:methylated-DNA--[protein]-cysteine S-methyltransferase [Parasporobacterium sp.]
MNYIWHYDSPLGGITLGSDGKALTGLWFDGQKYFPDTIEKESIEKDLPVFHDTKCWLDIYFSGRIPEFTPEMNMVCSDFRRSVWEVMLTIPYGHTMTYGEIAAEIAKKKGLEKMSARAVGGAVGHNAISVIIPCHRVIGADGSLTGYAGGIDRKRWLLEHEGTNIKSDLL